MPNIKSAIKRVKVAEKKRMQNKPIRSAVRTYIKTAEKSLGVVGRVHEPAANSAEAVQRAIRALDMAQTKGVLHPNNVARRKSRLMAKYNKIMAAQAGNA